MLSNGTLCEKNGIKYFLYFCKLRTVLPPSTLNMSIRAYPSLSDYPIYRVQVLYFCLLFDTKNLNNRKLRGPSQEVGS